MAEKCSFKNLSLKHTKKKNVEMLMAKRAADLDPDITRWKNIWRQNAHMLLISKLVKTL